MAVPGLLLTGGASSRMGVAKATLLLDGERLVDRAARLLLAVCDPVVEVGPGYSALVRVDEAPPGRGPLAALVAGADAAGGSGPVFLLACDLPFVGEALLARLVTWPGPGTVVPVDRDGVVQPVCARYSAAALERARNLLASGERSLRPLLRRPDVTRVDDVGDRELEDVDTPEDAARWGIRRPGSLEE
ncbi:MAG: molybdenum cofactor guanylyltransferase [Acidimicrobiia bacterium]